MQASISGSKAAAANLLSTCKLDQVAHTLDECIAAHEWMLQEPAAEASAARFFITAQAVYPWSSVFSGRQRLPLPDEELCQRLQAMTVQEITT